MVIPMSPPARRRRSRRALLLAGLILSPLSAAQAAAGNANQANVTLRTDLNTMTVQVGQRAPLPPGGCTPGYTWHTTYGGCRIAQKQSESTKCPSGQTGTRSRARTAFILQADPANVVYEGWGAWQNSCQAPRAPSRVILTWVSWPKSGPVPCDAHLEWKVRATYENGSPAQGLALTWTSYFSSGIEYPGKVITTNANGEASTYSQDLSWVQALVCVVLTESVVTPGASLKSFTAPPDNPGQSSIYLVSAGADDWIATRVRWTAPTR